MCKNSIVLKNAVFLIIHCGLTSLAVCAGVPWGTHTRPGVVLTVGTVLTQTGMLTSTSKGSRRTPLLTRGTGVARGTHTRP